MENKFEDSDQILSWALQRLSPYIRKSAWTSIEKPRTFLLNECKKIILEPNFAEELQEYMDGKPWLKSSIDMLIANLSYSTQPRPTNTEHPFYKIMIQGWSLGRWIPTFLVIDGPIGRFVGKDSPLSHYVKSSFPILASVKNLFNNQKFTFVRNGFAHWSFEWQYIAGDSYIVIFDDEKNRPPQKFHWQDLEAFHIVSFAIIDVIDEVFISKKQR